jgi:WD40 repeat protein
VAVVTSEGVQVRSVRAQGSVRGLRGRPERVHTIAFSPDGAYLAAASPERVWVWRVESEQAPIELEFSEGVEQLTFMPDGQTLITAGRSLQCWHMDSTGISRAATIEPQLEQARAMALFLNPRSRAIMLAVALDRRVLVWEQRLRKPSGGPARAATSRMTSASVRGPAWKRLATLESATAQEGGIAFSSDGQYLLISTLGAVEIWEIKGEQCVRRLEPGPPEVWDVAFAPDGKTLAICSELTVQVWDVGTEHLIRTITPDIADVAGINTVALGPGGQIVAIGTDDAIQLLRVSDQTRLASVSGEHNGAQRLVFGRDGNVIAALTGSSMRLWRIDGRGLTSLATIQSHTDRITDVAFGADWQTFATASYDGTVRVWTDQGQPAEPPDTTHRTEM